MGHGRPERALGRRGTCCDTLLSADDTTANQTTTRHSWFSRAGLQSHDGKANDDEGTPRLQSPDHIRTLWMH